MTRITDSLGLGIDAGGTFTDGAVVDLQTGTVLSKFKTQTTKDDLTGGIRRCLDGLKRELLPHCVLASLSTTFATNAIVESRGARAGAILLGYDSYDVAKVQADCKIAVPGSHDMRGRVLQPLDEQALRKALRHLIDTEHVEALAVSAMGGVLNPAHEVTARKIISQECDLPVVCGHELSMELGAIRRATTSYLNARLLPIVVDLIHALESELRQAGIQAPIMVVRSDGSLMSMSDALAHPIHTVFSGPAASAIGALYLSGLKAAMMADIGGTTTDILFAEDGEIGMSLTGTSVSGFDVSTPMVKTHTLGFGGDSHIKRDAYGKITIGPQRVLPLCVLGQVHPAIVKEMRLKRRGNKSTLCQPVEYFVRGWAAASGALTRTEEQIMEALSDGPKSGAQLAQACDCAHESLLPIDRLERRGSILRSGLTPTDIMHVLGQFVEWDQEASRLALSMYANDLGLSVDEFCERVLLTVKEGLMHELLSGALYGASTGSKSPDQHRSFARSILDHESGFVRLSPQFPRPVIGIGAPVEAYLPPACRELGLEPVIPEHSEVANAVGAVVGRVALKTKAVISPGTDGYAVHSPLTFRRFLDLEKAEAYAVRQVKKYLTDRVHADYAGLRFRYEVHTLQRTAQSADGEVLVESVVTGTAVCASMPTRM